MRQLGQCASSNPAPTPPFTWRCRGVHRCSTVPWGPSSTRSVFSEEGIYRQRTDQNTRGGYSIIIAAGSLFGPRFGLAVEPFQLETVVVTRKTHFGSPPHPSFDMQPTHTNTKHDPPLPCLERPPKTARTWVFARTPPSIS